MSIFCFESVLSANSFNPWLLETTADAFFQIIFISGFKTEYAKVKRSLYTGTSAPRRETMYGILYCFFNNKEIKPHGTVKKECDKSYLLFFKIFLANQYAFQA